MTEQRCGTCRFWRVQQCRRYAPRTFGEIPEMPTGQWPFVAEGEWCGEWRPKRQRELAKLIETTKGAQP